MSNTLFSSRQPVTVLMAVYNGARFLNEAIESIRNQTFTDFEFPIIDDGSSDATPEILARHAADRRIRILRQENQGLTESLNRTAVLRKIVDGWYMQFEDCRTLTISSCCTQ